MQLTTLLSQLNSFFPFVAAMPGDSIGLQIETESTSVNGILFTLEVTEEVINECNRLNFNTIVTFHPLIYSKLSEISLSERVGKLCSLLIKSSINLISIHTAFDAHINGTSSILANMLELNIVSFLEPNNSVPNSGMGVIATPGIATTTLDILAKLSSICGSPLRYCGNGSDILHRIAIVGGSGTSFIEAVLANKCDCFITADVTYHQFHAAKHHFALIDVGHYEMEQFVPQGIQEVLQAFLTENSINYTTSKVLTNPIQYYPKNNYLEIQNKNLIS